jgi:hypothetical protein
VEDGRRCRGVKGDGKLRLGRRYVGKGGRVAERIGSAGIVKVERCVRTLRNCKTTVASHDSMCSR